MNDSHLSAITDVIQVLEDNTNTPVSSKQASLPSCYSYSRFHHIFKQTMGETLGQYIRGRKLCTAADKLNHTTIPIIDIAFSCGYESQEAFTRAFKKRYGITPQAYRNRGINVCIAKHSSALTCNGEITIVKTPEIVTIPNITIQGYEYVVNTIQNTLGPLCHKFSLTYVENDTKSKQYSVFETVNNACTNTFTLETPKTVFIGATHLTDTKLTKKTIQGGTFAKFTHTGPINEIIHTYQYIWGVWLPSSHYQIGPGEDFEQYATSPTEKQHTSIYISIQNT